jgi:hypothetical protein
MVTIEIGQIEELWRCKMLLPAKTMGKEQLILLGTQQTIFTLTTEPPQVKMSTGIHTVVVSGYASLDMIWMPGDDDIIADDEVEFLAGPLWRDVAQVSASIWPSGIVSRDADEVDHSKWEVSECTWEVITTTKGERIKLHAKIRTQGDGNGWTSLGYHFVATGDLRRLPTVEEISADFN